MTTAFVDMRPGQLDLAFRAGNQVQLTLAYPAGTLAGHTITATLAGLAITTSIAGDILTVTASTAVTTGLAGSVPFVLTDNAQITIVGDWFATIDGTPSPTGTVTVKTLTAPVTVTVIGAAPGGGGGGAVTSVDGLAGVVV